MRISTGRRLAYVVGVVGNIPSGQLIRINAASGSRPQYEASDRFLCGVPMPMRSRPKTSTAHAAPWRALTILALFVFLATSASASIHADSEPFAAKAVVAISSLDCAVALPGSNHAQCQNIQFGTGGGLRVAVPFVPFLASSFWIYAAVTCGPSPADERLHRPPKVLRARV